MTDKATVEIPSPVAGKVLALGGPWASPWPWAPSWCGWRSRAKAI
jgi:hypothetical protein